MTYSQIAMMISDLEEKNIVNITEDDIVLIHDGVRPYIELDIIASIVKEASKTGAAIPCIMPKDTIRDINSGSLERSDLRCVQTPQGFSAALLMDAYNKAFAEGGDGLYAPADFARV